MLVLQEVGIFFWDFPSTPTFLMREQPNPDKDLIFNGRKKEGDIKKLILPSKLLTKNDIEGLFVLN